MHECIAQRSYKSIRILVSVIFSKCNKKRKKNAESARYETFFDFEWHFKAQIAKKEPSFNSFWQYIYLDAVKKRKIYFQFSLFSSDHLCRFSWPMCIWCEEFISYKIYERNNKKKKKKNKIQPQISALKWFSSKNLRFVIFKFQFGGT